MAKKAKKAAKKRAGNKAAKLPSVLAPDLQTKKPTPAAAANGLERAQADLTKASMHVGELKGQYDAAVQVENDAREALRKAAEEKRDADQRDLDKQRAGEA